MFAKYMGSETRVDGRMVGKGRRRDVDTGSLTRSIFVIRN